MLCYRDMTFCGFYETCKDGENCFRALTENVKKEAKKHGYAIAQFVSAPTECYQPGYEKVPFVTKKQPEEKCYEKDD